MNRRVTSPIFVGRSVEAEILGSAVRAAAEGRPSMAVVAGDAGVGKTRLIRQVEQQVRGQDGLVLRGECMALSGEFPYAPIVGALRDARRGALAAALALLSPESRSEIGRLVPEITAELAGDSAQLNQGRLFERLLALLRHLGDEAPVLFVVEDAHWADASTLDFLSFLSRNLSTERVAAVATYRPDELEPQHPLRLLLTELMRSERVMSLTLAPLDGAEIERLIEHIAGTAPPRALSEEIFTRSQGNPFFVEELLAASTNGDRAELPATLRDALLVRCHGLSADAVQLVRTLAVLGRSAHHAQLGSFAGMPEPRLSAALRSTLEAHIVAHRTHDDSFEFRHALLREALCSDLLPGERSALHRAIAADLAASGDGTPAELAFHWDLAGEPAQALGPSIRAGLDAERVYASAEARQHFERAVRLWNACDATPDGLALDRVELLRHTAEVARLMGDWDTAIARCREAIARVDARAEPLRAALLHERAGEYLVWDDDAALECYSTALALLPADCRCERARILGAKALGLHFQQRWEESRDCSREALDEARAAGARKEEGYAANVLGLALAFLGDHAEGEDHVRAAKAIAEACGTAEDTARSSLHLAEVLRIRGKVHAALEVTLQGELYASRMGMENFGSAMSATAAEDLVRLGRWDDAAEHLALTEQRELSVLAELVRRSVRGRLAVGRGEPDVARAHLQRALDLCGEQMPVEYLVAPHAGLAELALWERRPGDARSAIAAAFALIGGREEPLYAPVLFWLGVRAEIDAALAARPRSAARRDHDEAAARHGERLADLTERYSSTHEPPEAAAYIALCRAERTRLELGQPESWSAAGRAWSALEHPVLEAYAGWRMAEAVLGGGHPRGDIAQRLRATRAAAAGLGALPLLHEIEKLARAARIDVLPPDTAPSSAAPSSAAALGLTPREIDVLELVAEGCTNREISQRLFISEKTTSVHVSHILRKLDAETRVRAAATAHRLGLFDTRGQRD